MRFYAKVAAVLSDRQAKCAKQPQGVGDLKLQGTFGKWIRTEWVSRTEEMSCAKAQRHGVRGGARGPRHQPDQCSWRFRKPERGMVDEGLKDLHLVVKWGYLYPARNAVYSLSKEKSLVTVEQGKDKVS
jgi:hypothetical protein